MGRWEPDARGRLVQAALTLYAERGVDRTTAADIAQLAGLTERTFFRHFADKREVLFHGMETGRDLLVRAIADAPASATPLDAVGAALDALGARFEEDPDRLRRRDAVIAAHADLRERELAKLAAFASAMAGALRDRGIPEPAASLAAETGIAVFKVAFARWIATPGRSGLRELLHASLERLKGMIADGSAGSTASRRPATSTP